MARLGVLEVPDHLLKLRLGSLPTLLELVEHLTSALDALSGGLKKRVECPTVVVVVLKDVACHKFSAFGAAHKDGLGATGITDDNVFELL